MEELKKRLQFNQDAPEEWHAYIFTVGEKKMSPSRVEQAAEECGAVAHPSGGDQDFEDSYWTKQDIKDAFIAGARAVLEEAEKRAIHDPGMGTKVDMDDLRKLFEEQS